MREFTQRLSREDLSRGLQPKELGFGSTHAVDLLNLRPEQEGLQPYSFLRDPFDGGIPTDWPFPQLVEATDSLYLLQETAVDKITESVPWSLTNQDTLDARNTSTSLGIPLGGNQWQVAQAQNSWYAVKGNCVVFNVAPEATYPGDSNNAVYVDDQLNPEAACYQKGRYFMGGFTGNFWAGELDTVISDWESNVGIATTQRLEPSENWIAYGSIGGGDFPLWLMRIGSSTPPSQLSAKDKIAEALERNEFGFMPLNVEGKVLALEPLGDNVVAYCDEAVFLIQLEFPASEEIPATVGQRQITDVGVASKGAVGGSESRHVFVDQIGRLQEVRAGEGVQELGYSNQFEPLVNEPARITNDPTGQDLYIGFRSKGFLLTSQGLCEIGESPTWLRHRGTSKNAMTREHGKTNALFVGAPNDFADPGRKTAMSIAVGYSGSADINAAWDYRERPGQAWSRTDFQTLNDKGIAYNRVTGEAFRPVLEFPEPESVNIDYVELRFQLPDKRHQRGPRAGELNS